VRRARMDREILGAWHKTKKKCAVPEMSKLWSCDQGYPALKDSANPTGRVSGREVKIPGPAAK